jgi:hypothetical protein
MRTFTPPICTNTPRIQVNTGTRPLASELHGVNNQLVIDITPHTCSHPHLVFNTTGFVELATTRGADDLSRTPAHTHIHDDPEGMCVSQRSHTLGGMLDQLMCGESNEWLIVLVIR